MNDILKVAICEDTPADAEKLLALLKECSVPCQCRLFSSAEAFLAEYHPQLFDLLLTDIYMGGMTGIDAVTRIRQVDEELPVAFITTSTEHTLESYRLSALKYIEKPFRQKEIEDILKLARMERDNAPALDLQQKGRDIHLRLSRIVYAEQKTHQLCFYLQGGETEMVYEKISALMPRLEQYGFVSPHKSFAVNLASVREIDTELRCFVMQDGSNVPIRRESMGKAKKALADFLFHRTRGMVR